MYDRIPEPPLNPPEDVIFTYCKYCGGEIYEGENYYAINGENICVDCLRDFADCIEEATHYAY
jgi:alkyl hydroperoxide reductase subunit AhpF